jgi:hypothetical protein
LPQISISHFVERPGVINDIIANITNKSEEDTQPAVLVLCGMGGQGKSQIALKYCRSTAAMEKYRNIFWIDASSEMTTIQAFTKMASVLSGKDQFGSRKYLTQDKVKEELETWNEQWLLVFDNFDDPQAFQIHKFIPQSTSSLPLSQEKSHFDPLTRQ